VAPAFYAPPADRQLSLCPHLDASEGYTVLEVGKVTLKSNGDEALNDEFLLKSNGDEALNDSFP
jgi:hypothetical protein